MNVSWLKMPTRALAALFVLGLGTGCASVDPSPFAQFESSLQSLRSGSDTQAGAAVAASRLELVARVASGQVSPADLQLAFNESSPFATSYGFAEQEPNFVKLMRFRQGLAELNDVMIDYAQSLVLLSGGDAGGDILPTSAQLDQMATGLNADAGAAAAALGLKVDPQKQALLSTAAVQLFKTYLEHKRRKDLAAAIQEVQPRIDEFANAARQAVHFLASMVQTDYNEAFLPLATAQPANAVPILALNDSTQATLSTLDGISRSYAALPQAHRDLAEAASKKPGALAGLTALTNEAIRLQGFVNQLTQANEAAAAARSTNP